MKPDRAAVQIIVVAVAAVALNARTMPDPDLGWALDAGARILDGVGFPVVNEQSFTEPSHTVVLHGWVTDVFFAFAQRILGGTGIALSRALLVALDAVAVWWACTRRSQHALVRTLFPIIAVALAPTLFLLARAQLTSFGLLALVVGALLDERRRVRFFVLLSVFAAWPNLHGAFPAGVAFVFAWAAGAACEKIVGRGADVPWLDVVGLPLLALAAPLANPYGIGMWRMIASTEKGDYQSLLPEWSPSWEPHVFAVVWPQLAVLFAFGVAAFWLLPRGDIRFRLVAVAMMFLMVSTSRHLRLAPALIVPIFAAAVAPFADGKLSSRLTSVAIAVTGVVAAAALALQLPLRLSPVGLGLPRSTTVAFLVENQLSGNVWTPLVSGGEVLWACPRCKVSLDGRALNAYSPSWFTHALRMEPFPDKAALRSADYAIAPADAEVLRYFAPEFFPLYCDGERCVLSSREADKARSYRFPPDNLPDSRFFEDPGRPKF